MLRHFVGINLGLQLLDLGILSGRGLLKLLRVLGRSDLELSFLASLRCLQLTGEFVTLLLDGLESLEKLWFSGNPLTCADLANQTVLPADVNCAAGW